MNRREAAGAVRELPHFIGGDHVAGRSGRFGDVFDPTSGALAARANAIFDATGARLHSVPFTPERVRAVLS